MCRSEEQLYLNLIGLLRLAEGGTFKVQTCGSTANRCELGLRREGHIHDIAINKVDVSFHIKGVRGNFTINLTISNDCDRFELLNFASLYDDASLCSLNGAPSIIRNIDSERL